MSKKQEILSIDDKLDRIMEAVLFQQQLHVTTLKALDIILGKKASYDAKREEEKSKIIKPIGLT